MNGGVVPPSTHTSPTTPPGTLATAIEPPTGCHLCSNMAGLPKKTVFGMKRRRTGHNGTSVVPSTSGPHVAALGRISEHAR